MANQLVGRPTSTLHEDQRIICSREIFNLGCYGRPVKDHGVVATDAEEKEYHSKGGERDPEGSIM